MKMETFHRSRILTEANLKMKNIWTQATVKKCWFFISEKNCFWWDSNPLPRYVTYRMTLGMTLLTLLKIDICSERCIFFIRSFLYFKWPISEAIYEIQSYKKLIFKKARNLLTNERASFEPHFETFSIIAFGKIALEMNLAKWVKVVLVILYRSCILNFILTNLNCASWKTIIFRKKKNQNFRVTSHGQKHKTQISNFHTKYNPGKETN